MPRPSLREFCERIGQSGLMPRAAVDEHLERFQRRAARDKAAFAEFFAAWLVRRKVLTRFQAELLYTGAPVQLVFDKYRILEPLGHGGVGRVYRAHDPQLNRVVALKVLRRSSAKDPLRVKRFLREAQAAAQLDHPNIVRVIDVGVENRLYYIVMEYVEGRPLDAYVQSHGPLSVEQAVEITKQVASGLAHAHERSIVHRDVKPSNVMLMPSGRAKILDMGLALMSDVEEEGDGLTGLNIAVGSMDYISPEQAEDSHRVDARADVYSLGCSLYFMLAGQPPFPGGTLARKLHRHRTEPPRPITDFRSDVPLGLLNLLSAMMAKEPERRVASCAKIEELLGGDLSRSLAIGDETVEELAPDDSLAGFLAALEGVARPFDPSQRVPWGVRLLRWGLAAAGLAVVLWMLTKIGSPW